MGVVPGHPIGGYPAESVVGFEYHRRRALCSFPQVVELDLKVHLARVWVLEDCSHGSQRTLPGKSHISCWCFARSTYKL